MSSDFPEEDIPPEKMKLIDEGILRLICQIENHLKECLNLKDRKQCENCYEQIEKSAQYCPNCGEKQEISDENDDKEEEKGEAKVIEAEIVTEESNSQDSNEAQ
mgnify:CR=1 FL=1